MSREIRIRLQADGSAQVIGEFDRAADAGDRLGQRIRGATTPANAGLKALDAAAQDARGSLDGMVASLGPVGNVARAFGPLGIAAGAAVGGIMALSRASAQAHAEIAAIGDAADRLQIDPVLFERLSASLTLQGQRGDGLEQAIRTVQQRLGEARGGVAAAADEFRRLGVDLGGDLTQTLGNVAEALTRIEDPAQRAAVANRLFGESGGALLTVLGNGRDGFEALRQKAEELGLLYGGDLIRESQRVTAQFEAQERLITTRLNQGLAGFSGLWLSVRSAIADAALALGGFLDRFRDLENASVGELERRIAGIDQRLSRMGEIGGTPESMFNDYQIERLRQERAALAAQVEARGNWQPPSTVYAESAALGSGGGGGGGGGAGREQQSPFNRAVEAADRQRLALDMQARTFGMTAEAAAAYRVEQELLHAAVEEYGHLAPWMEQTAHQHGMAYREAAEEARRLKEAQEEQTRAAGMTQRAFEAAGDAMVSWIGEIERSEKPLQTLLRLTAQLALQTVSGRGPFGEVFNSILGVAAGGLFGLLAPGSNVTTGTPITSARLPPMRAAAGADFVVPGAGGIDSRRLDMAVTPGERVRVTRPGDPEPAAAASGVTLNLSTHVTVAAAEAGDDPAAQGRTIARAVELQVLRVLQDQLRPGGLLRPMAAV